MAWILETEVALSAAPNGPRDGYTVTHSPEVDEAIAVDAGELTGARTFLKARPTGVYSCARAFVANRSRLQGLATTSPASAAQDKADTDADANGNAMPSVVLWQFHLDRLALGWRTQRVAMQDKGQEARVQMEEALISALQATTSQLVTRLVGTVRGKLLADASDVTDELMVTVLWRTEEEEEDDVQKKEDATALRANVSVHACPLPQAATQEATVLVHGDARSNAVCKHSQWISQRLPLEQHRAAMAAALSVAADAADPTPTVLHESILSLPAGDNDRALLEGSTSNFFVVKDGCIYTAQEHVLMGSTRSLVLRALEELQIPVVFQAPRLSEVTSWQAAFLTSCTQLVIPIVRVYWHPTAPPPPVDGTFETPAVASAAIGSSLSHELLTRIRAHIQERWMEWE